MPSSEWTLDTLKAHFDALRAADGVALQAALAAAKEAVAVAKVSTDERLKLLNELRSGVATTAAMEALDKVVQDVTVRLVRLEESKSTTSEQKVQTNSVRQWQVGLVVAVIALIGVLLKAKGL